MSQDILINIENYNGPLDLLLDLIKKNEINIYDIPINFITQEYLDTIRKNLELGIEIQVEFLYLAATLLNIKTRMLLPKTNDDDEDPRTNLVEQLIAYSRFKIVQNDMRLLFDLNYNSYDRVFDPNYFNINTEYELQFNLNKLIASYKELIENIDSGEEDILILKERYKTEDLIDNIKERLFNFNSLTLKELSKNKNREYLITSFLAILELLNSGLITCKQDGLFSEIILEKRNIWG